MENEEKNKQNINENVKRHVLKRKKTKIRNFFLDKKKSNKFLEKIKNIKEIFSLIKKRAINFWKKLKTSIINIQIKIPL